MEVDSTSAQLGLSFALKKNARLKVSGKAASDQSWKASATKHGLSLAVRMSFLCANTVSAICPCIVFMKGACRLAGNASD